MFAPGDEVECIDTNGDELLAVGAIYTVAEFLAAGDGHDNWWVDVDCVQLVEVGHVENDEDYGFEAHRFRKIQKRLDSLSIEAFLTIKPGFEEPKRAPARKAVDA